MSRALGVVRAQGKGLRGFWAHVVVQQLSIQREMWLGNGNCSPEPHHHSHVVAAMVMDLRALVSGKVPPIRFAMPRATFSTLPHWIRKRSWWPALSTGDAPPPPPPVRALRHRRVRANAAQLGWGGTIHVNCWSRDGRPRSYYVYRFDLGVHGPSDLKSRAAAGSRLN
jgi:hypothetical protein